MTSSKAGGALTTPPLSSLPMAPSALALGDMGAWGRTASKGGGEVGRSTHDGVQRTSMKKENGWVKTYSASSSKSRSCWGLA
jgi:hypothetical protein